MGTVDSSIKGTMQPMVAIIYQHTQTRARERFHSINEQCISDPGGERLLLPGEAGHLVAPVGEIKVEGDVEGDVDSDEKI